MPDWLPAHGERWGRSPQCIPHRLHEHPLFSPTALSALIESYPRGNYSLILTNRNDGEARRWSEGYIDGVRGRDVIDAIAAGSLWLNLREVDRVDGRYAELMAGAYEELARRMPGFEPSAIKMGILISSPRARVHYHCDLPGQMLWQIQGRKRAWIYPPEPPYLLDEWLEDIALTGFELRMTHDPAFDEAAAVFDLAPGGMLNWPLNSPHRIENADCLNISVTTEHWTPHNRRSQQVALANAVLRHSFGVARPDRRLSGPTYWAKAALQAGWRRSPWAQRRQAAARPIEFRLTPDADGRPNIVFVGQN